jgi:hypothetical protein
MALNISEAALSTMKAFHQMFTNIYQAPSMCQELSFILSSLILQQLYAHFGVRK